MQCLRLARNGLLLLTCAIASGCTAYVEKGAQGLPDNETARIRAIDKFLTIATVDGVDTWWIVYTSRREYRLTPGPHRLEVKRWIDTRATPSIFRDVTLVAGREYGMKRVESDDWFGFVIEDLATGERVDSLIGGR